MTILPPKGSDTRPITDRVKESIFDVLYKYNLIEGRIVADLFCGTMAGHPKLRPQLFPKRAQPAG